MNNTGRRLVVAALAGLGVVQALSGCTTEAMARGEPPADLSGVKVGATRAQIEAQLGRPVRNWTTPAGVEYRLYRYDAGVPGDPSAHLLTLITILTFGLPELMYAAEDKGKASAPQPKDPQRFRNVAVSYGSTGDVLGVFIDVSDFASLPPDGLSPSRR